MSPHSSGDRALPSGGRGASSNLAGGAIRRMARDRSLPLVAGLFRERRQGGTTARPQVGDPARVRPLLTVRALPLPCWWAHEGMSRLADPQRAARGEECIEVVVLGG